MPRPCIHRRVAGKFNATYFKPAGIPLKMLEEISLGLDELEAIRLADMEGMYHADAAKKMNISRQTFGNILKSSHQKIADAMINGKAVRVEGEAPVSYLEKTCNCPKSGSNKGRKNCRGGYNAK